MTASAVRWGVVGTGWISGTVVPDIGLTGNAEVVAVSSRDQARASEFARSQGIPRAYAAYAELLADPQVDAVYLGTPIGSHEALASAAIDAGKHVLVEKAITPTAREAEALAQRARDAGVFLMEGMWMRFSPTIAAVLAEIASGTIGEVRHVTSGFGFAVPRDPSSRYWDAAQGGGALLDMGIYCVTLTTMLMGDPELVAAFGTVEPDGVDSRVVASLRAGEVTAQLTTSIEHAVDPSATIDGTAGFLRLASPFWMSSSYDVFPEGARPGAPSRTVTSTREGKGFVPMFRSASADILAGRTQSSVHPMVDSVRVLDIIGRIRRALLAD